MADISSITLLDGNTYNFKDTVARQSSGGGSTKVVTISLSATWQGNNPYTQTVTVSGGTANSVVDLRPDATVIAALLTAGCKALYVENNSGTFTAYAIGNKPSSALTVQATVTEVST